MIDFKRWLSIAGVAVLALGANAGQAGTRNDGHRSISVSETFVALGRTVPPGSYTLRWTREFGSENVRIEITHGRKVLASGNGVWVSADAVSPYEALVFRNDSGARELSEIRFEHSADRIRLETVSGNAEALKGTDSPSEPH